jgi:hypothetical protein
MDTFAQAVEGWHDFYLMVGTAAATQVGLLFVSLSLNADVITRKENADLRVLAGQTFASFLNVVMLAVLFLIPSQGPLGLGLPLLGISGYGLYETVGRFLKTRRARPHVWGRGGVARRFVIPTLFCDATDHRRVGAAGPDRRSILARARDDLADCGSQSQCLGSAVTAARAARRMIRRGAIAPGGIL